MRIGPIGSNAFTDFYRSMSMRRVEQAPKSGDSIKAAENKNMDYLERQARNAQRQEMSLQNSTFDVSL